MLEALEKELAAAARAERLVAVVPDRGLATADVGVSGAELLDRGSAGICRYDHLT
jgi:hypothetical protein